MASRKTKPVKKSPSKKKSAAPKKPKAAAKAPVRATSAATPKQDAAALLAELPALTQAHRDGFEEQFDDADCMNEGERTKSLAVRNCALSWVAEVKPALTASGTAANVDYGAERLTWIVELVVQLDDARASQGGRGTAQGGVRTTRDVAREKAKQVRTRLLSKLRRALPSSGADRATFDTARATIRSDDDLAASLESIAGLIKDLVGRSDAGTAARLDSARIVVADVGTARGAAEALTGAKEGVTLGGRARGDHDTPDVNLVEGRVLKELRLLDDAIVEARERGIAVPALIVPPGLRAALGRRSTKAGEPDPDPPGAPPGAGGAPST